MTQNTKNKIFWSIVGLVFAGSVGVSFWRFVIKRDYLIFGHGACDPAVESCFIDRCDATATEDDANVWVCTGDVNEDVKYFAIHYRNASRIPLCDSTGECDPFVCDDGEEECGVIYCGEPNDVMQQAECTNPRDYQSTQSNDVIEENAVK